ncbi:hypothetical protein [Evansella tamaricis]|uniref:Uncharacterized protein n=1 Tax=Evansella tamaricis TaxID=2069301 RepID=A0ABS6JN05_9BACI|nr:hypothetical protein [Evansella tamaricis]MBU9714918.1 hypothetical protein [Evansella tamaricis]
MKNTLFYWIRYLLLVSILVISSISLIIVYSQGYLAEIQMARALPLALVLGLSAIALAIFEISVKR